jgi:hypothetical protein
MHVLSSSDAPLNMFHYSYIVGLLNFDLFRLTLRALTSMTSVTVTVYALRDVKRTLNPAYSCTRNDVGGSWKSHLRLTFKLPADPSVSVV